MNDFLGSRVIAKFLFEHIKKAGFHKLAFCVFGLCFVVMSAVLAKAPHLPAEKTTLDIHQKVEQLLREKKKNTAMRLLIAEMNALVPNKQGGAKRDLSKPQLAALQAHYELYLRLSRAFETDRAQQIYELAMSSKKSNSALALQKMDEALLIEPTQVLLLVEKVRLLLGKKDCLGAGDALSPLKEKYYFDEEVNLLLLQQALCLQKPIEGSLVSSKRQVPLIKLEWLWLSLGIQHKILTKHWQSVPEEIEKLKALDVKYPEISYFEWTIGMQTKNYRVSMAQKYLTQCEEISGFSFRRYNVDPLLCQRTVEVSEDLKNLKKKQGG